MRKQLRDTPPASPNYFSPDMEDDVEEVDEDLFADDVEEVNVELVETESDDSSPGAAASRDDSQLVFSKHVVPVFCCELEPTAGILAVTGGMDEKACIWSTQTGEIVLESKGYYDSVVGVGFSYDGTYVAIGDMCGIVKVLKVASKSLVWETNVGDLEWLQWHHGANVLLGGTVHGEIYMWRIPGGATKVLPGNGKKTQCGLIFPDGKRAAAGYEGGSIKVFDLKAGTVLHHFSEGQAHQDDLTSMDCHPDNNLLITSGVDGRALVLTSQTGKVVSVLDCSDLGQESDGSKHSVEAVGFYGDPSLSLAATGTLKGMLCIWDISKGVQRHKVQLESGITKLVWDKSNPLIYTGTLDGNIAIYDARSGALEKQLMGHSESIMDLSLSRASNILLTASDDSTARVFSI